MLPWMPMSAAVLFLEFADVFLRGAVVRRKRNLQPLGECLSKIRLVDVEEPVAGLLGNSVEGPHLE